MHLFHKKIFISIVTLSLLIGCDGYDYLLGKNIFGNTKKNISTVVVSGPLVTTTIPLQSAVSVLKSSFITINFKSKILGSSVNKNNFKVSKLGIDIKGLVTFNSDTNTAIFTPDLNLDLGSNYTVTLSKSITDLLGNPMKADYIWTFRTMEPTAPEKSATLSLSLGSIKTFDLTWTDVSDATFYRIQQQIDVGLGFNQVGGDIMAGIQRHSLIVPLYARIGSQYQLQSCNPTGCTDSSVVIVGGTLEASIGYLKSSETTAGDEFGYSIDISTDGNTLAVGAIKAGSPGTEYGAVNVFVRSGATWVQQSIVRPQVRTPSDRTHEDYFGHSVSLSSDGNTLAVGAINEDGNGTKINDDATDDGTNDNSGAAYIFTRTGDTWVQKAYVKASNSDAGDAFGWAVSLSSDGSTLAVSAISEASNATGVSSVASINNSLISPGAVYIFSRTGDAWAHQAYVKASNTGAGDAFGSSISLSANGNTLAVGAINEEIKQGAVYMYNRTISNWSPGSMLKPTRTESGDLFGSSVSLSSDGNTLAIAAKHEDSSSQVINVGDDINGASFSGAAYVFNFTGTSWSQTAYIKAKNSGSFDRFGQSVSLSSGGDMLAVGARLEEGSNKGIDGEDNDDIFNSGAAYIFTLNGTTWSQQAYVKARNPDIRDQFGYSVSLSGDGITLAIGAPFEDGSSVGINGNDNNSSEKAGAAYLF